jgi:hypothetical protein
MKKKPVKSSKNAKRPSLQELSEADLAKASGGYMNTSSGDPNGGDCSRTCSGWTWTPFKG